MNPSGSVVDLDPGYLRSCCAEVWSHPALRVLSGDFLHPGGSAMSSKVLDLLELPAGSTLLDVGTGPGATRDLAAERGVSPAGVDVGPQWGSEERRGWFVAGDAGCLPFRDGAFAGAVAECVLSIIPDKAAALEEVRRVTGPTGRVAIADVTSPGVLPDELRTLLGWIACAAGALPLEGYLEGLRQSGFRPIHVEDAGAELREMIAKIRRRLALIQGAAATRLVDLSGEGLPTDLLDLGQGLLGVAADAVERGDLGYALIVAA